MEVRKNEKKKNEKQLEQLHAQVNDILKRKHKAELEFERKYNQMGSGDVKKRWKDDEKWAWLGRYYQLAVHNPNMKHQSIAFDFSKLIIE